MKPEMMYWYFHAELVQLIINQSDSQLEVQQYGMKKNTLTVDPIMLEDELWMTRQKPSRNHWSQFLKTKLWKLSFRFLNFEVSLVFENWYPTFSSGSAHP